MGRHLSSILREVWFGRVWRVNACRIVEENAERIVLWMPHGVPAKYPTRGDGGELRVPGGEWALAERRTPRDALAVCSPGGRHSLWHFWDGDGSLAYWYVNFERPLVRTPLGFDYRDDKLDLVVAPDGSWRLKDEDELEEAARLGLVDAAEVRAEAERVLADPPWPSGWERWRPDPDWPLPSLPDGWDVV